MSESKLDEEIVEWLKKSREQVGELEPVLVTAEGEVLDGVHRLKAYPGWKTQTVKVEGYRKIVERIHRNVHRRMTKAEVKGAVVALAHALEKQGTPKESLIDEIKKVLPFTEDYIRSFLPAKFKREYKRKIQTVKMLAPTAKPPAPPSAKPKEEKVYICPVCASRLKLRGEVLVKA